MKYDKQYFLLMGGLCMIIFGSFGYGMYSGISSIERASEYLTPYAKQGAGGNALVASQLDFIKSTSDGLQKQVIISTVLSCLVFDVLLILSVRKGPRNAKDVHEDNDSTTQA